MRQGVSIAERFQRVLDGKVQGDIVCGDCWDVMQQIPDRTVDWVCADPDYGVGVSFEPSQGSPLGRGGRRKSLEELRYELVPQLKEMKRISRLGHSILFWSGSPERLKDFFTLCEEAEYKIRHLGIWYKPNGAGPTGNGLGRRWEAWFWLSGDKAERESEWPFLPDVLVANRVVPGHIEAVNHPTQKPIKLIEQLMRFFSKPGDLVFDPFMGSGTTAVVANRLGRRWFGCDISEQYVEMALERIKKDGVPRGQVPLPLFQSSSIL